MMNSTKDHFIRYRKYDRRRKQTMTICISTICEQGTGNPRIVFASDRLVTDQDGYTFELGIPKIKSLAQHALLMEAGDSFRGDRILEKFRQKIPTFEEASGKKWSEIVETLRLCYHEIFEESIEAELFSPRGLTRKSFYEQFSTFPEWFSMMMDMKVEHFNFGVTFLLIGIEVDQERKIVFAHLTRFSGRGEPEILDSLGFAMAGIGEKMSFPELTKQRYSPNNSLADALVRTYWAKRASERMIGVGTKTDFGIMWIETDTTSGLIVCKNTLIEDKQARELFDAEFEKTKTAGESMVAAVTNKVDELLQGTKKIEST